MAVTTEEIKLWLDTNWPDKTDKLQGLESELPASATRPTLYFATDTKKIHAWNVDQWTSVNDSFDGTYTDAEGTLKLSLETNKAVIATSKTNNTQSMLSLDNNEVVLLGDGLMKLYFSSSYNYLFSTDMDHSIKMQGPNFYIGSNTINRLEISETRTQISSKLASSYMGVSDTLGSIIDYHDKDFTIRDNVRDRVKLDATSTWLVSESGQAKITLDAENVYMHDGTRNRLYFNTGYNYSFCPNGYVYTREGDNGIYQRIYNQNYWLVDDARTRIFVNSSDTKLISHNGTHQLNVSDSGIKWSNNSGSSWSTIGWANGVYNDGSINRVVINSSGSYIYGPTTSDYFYCQPGYFIARTSGRDRITANTSMTVFYSPAGTGQFRVTNSYIYTNQPLRSSSTSWSIEDNSGKDRVKFNGVETIIQSANADPIITLRETTLGGYISLDCHVITPKDDGLVYLGTSGSRYYKGYFKNGVTTSSDRRLKENITELNDKYVKLISEINPVTYTFKNNNKTKMGLIVQDLQELFVKNNLNPNNYDLIDIPETDDDGCEKGFYGLNYSELIAPLIKYTQSIDYRLNKLEKGE